ncbi:polyhydroxyalkanoate synthesis repressor PhaR [Caulobacter flavus]|uniref:Polyhydroxyalkanoate synthesis repressor PhaR n=1 Tax=Caulobacter flavus TaxID=1679497 RepID=A0A2N5D3R3_9CAUL|nr:polyhydroxyalkanoate synthesis repressor PhaR [Caulobacter flavus]AYV46063.1 polyhydroxyalkanoate synthesis repressor PhaR [Caulobacter flavus]PLR20673.1 polyhydroxyalkanoate synthesis repressor PhaR [Caulobacter flavus]
MSENPDKGEAAPGADKVSAEKGSGQRVVIKKYANRRLYNTASSSYVTLEHLSDMVKEGVDFVVYDAKTNDDITRSVLTQIIFEEENRGGGQNLLPIQFLRQLIGFYGNSMQAFLPSYLEMSLESFSKQQERMRQQFTGQGLGGKAAAPGMAIYEEQIRQNMALFDRAMKMFSPFAYSRPEDAASETPAAPPPPAPAPAAPSEDSLADLKRQLEAMQEQIAKLATKS